MTGRIVIVLAAFAVTAAVCLGSACDNHVYLAGEFGGPCRRDGSCVAGNLSCLWRGDSYQCVPPPPADTRRCVYEAECFCVTCAEKCGASGVKECAYSDTSVWGAKPAVCACK